MNKKIRLILNGFESNFMEEKFQLIRSNIEKHISLTNTEFDLFANYLQEKEIKKKQEIVSTGEVCNYTAFVNKGCVRSFSMDKDGMEQVLQFAMEDYWVGDLYSYLTDKPALYTSEATENCSLLLIYRNDMEKVYEQVPKFERFFRILVQRSYVSLQQRITFNQSSSAEEKYHSLLQKFPTIELRVAQKHIASYLGITPESLSRIKRKSYLNK